MPTYCTVHPKHKQGFCLSCCLYKCCEPGVDCEYKMTHIPFQRAKKRDLKKSGTLITPERKICRRSKRDIIKKRKYYESSSDDDVAQPSDFEED